jgi:AraC-like DNA-binding protein
MTSPERRDEGGDLDNFAEAYDRFLPGAKIVPPADRRSFRWSGQHTTAKGRSLWRVRLNGSVTTHAIGDRNLFGLIVPTVGGVQATLQRRNIMAKPGQALVLHFPEERDLEALCSSGEHARTTVTWRVPDWQGVFNSLYEENPERYLDLNSVLDFSEKRGNVFFPLLNAVVQDMSNPVPDLGLASVLMNEALLRLVFERANLEHRGTGPNRYDRALPRHIRLAIEYMRAHVGEPIAIRDVALACRITVRTLEVGFRAHLETTPLAYLRQIRLQAVHRELVTGHANLSISAIARYWGFVDMGRFSARYRQAFGELPSETLRRR